MAKLLDRLGVTNPVLAAPMAGGPTTPAQVVAATEAGSFGFLAGGYRSAEDLAGQIDEVRRATAIFGVNLFAPNPVPADPDAFHRYAQAIQPEGDVYQLDLAGSALVEDDDRWGEKIDLLLRHPVPVVSFTFGIPDPSVIRDLQRAGSLVVQTVTSLAEARLAVAAGVDALGVQGHEAGGHYGTLSPHDRPDRVPLADLVRRVSQAVDLPLIAAGGLSTQEEIAEILGYADAVMVGTMLLLTDESGTSAPYRQALTAGRDLETVVTRAFTGRPARALPNLFVERYDQVAPSGYPALHYLTSPMRRAAAAAGDHQRINLWAGTGHRRAQPGPAAEILARLGHGLGRGGI